MSKPSPAVFQSIDRDDVLAQRKRGSLSPKDILLNQAAELKKRSHQEGKEAGFDQGMAEGYQAGLQQGLIEGNRQAWAALEAERLEHISQFVSELDDAGARVNIALAQWVNNAEDQLVALATEVVQRVLHHELKTAPEAVLGIVRGAISEIGISKKVRLRVNPFDLPLISEHKAQFLQEFPDVQHVEVVADESITGGVMLEAETGNVDATLSTICELMEDQAA